MGLSGYGNKYLEIYLWLECLGENIGEIYHFALGDVFGSPSLEVTLESKLNKTKHRIIWNSPNRPILSPSLGFSSTLGGLVTSWRKLVQKKKELELGFWELEAWSLGN